MFFFGKKKKRQCQIKYLDSYKILSIKTVTKYGHKVQHPNAKLKWPRVTPLWIWQWRAIFDRPWWTTLVGSNLKMHCFWAHRNVMAIWWEIYKWVHRHGQWSNLLNSVFRLSSSKAKFCTSVVLMLLISSNCFLLIELKKNSVAKDQEKTVALSEFDLL